MVQVAPPESNNACAIIADVRTGIQMHSGKLKSAEHLVQEQERELKKYRLALRIQNVIVNGEVPNASDIEELERLLTKWRRLVN